MRISKEDRERSLATLRALLKPGDTVYTVLRSVSRSGMSRKISCFVVGESQEPMNITRHVHHVTGYPLSRTGEHAVSVSGCGMDMGFALVYDLSYRLFPEGFAVEGRGRNGDESGWDKDGGYALKQRWL